MSSGETTEVECLCKGVKEKFETKMSMVGEDDGVLNRIVRWHPRKGITYEVDPRHAEIISRDTGAEKLKTISTPAAKETGREKGGGEVTRSERAQIEWQVGRQD